MMAQLTRTLPLLLLLAGTSLACTPTLDEVKQKHGPAVVQVFARIKALEPKARAAAPVTQDNLQLGDKRVVLDGKDSNALFLHISDLPHPEFTNERGDSTILAADVNACGEVLRGDFPGVVGAAEVYLEECGRAEYAFVLRTAESQSAEVVGDEQFVLGKFRGDVLLFRIADGAPLGGFAVAAENNHSVTVNGGEIDTRRLEENLAANLFVRIKEKLNALAPGAVR